MNQYKKEAIDLTVIFLTLNRLPKDWTAYHQKILLHAIWRYPIITVSRTPLSLRGGVNIIQNEKPSASNIYRQMLKAAKVATTPYVAIAEDDSLYPREHYQSFRPELNEFSYNANRWSLMTWGVPTYNLKDRISNLTLIAPRELLIRCLEERFAKYPNGTEEGKTGEVGKLKTENLLGLPHYNMVQWKSINPIVNFEHIYALDDKEKRKVKRMSAVRAFDILYWGKSSELVKHFI
jgi:hypothetical protein